MKVLFEEYGLSIVEMIGASIVLTLISFYFGLSVNAPVMVKIAQIFNMLVGQR